MIRSQDRATFVMPHWSSGSSLSAQHLKEAVASVFAQTDEGWRLVWIDDGSRATSVHRDMRELEKSYPDQIETIFRPVRQGPGVCRNVGVQRAFELGSPFVLFLDSDDVAGAGRLEVVRQTFSENSRASVVYTGFYVIDEASNPISESSLTPSLREILASHREAPPQGPNAWIEIATNSGYTNLTSATSVRTDLAYRVPFPDEYVSEDSHTWMRYSAGGEDFVFRPESPTGYRIPRDGEGSSSRSREGGRREFYRAKASVDTDGFESALELALTKGKIERREVPDLRIRFHIRLGETLAKEKQFKLAATQVDRARLVSEPDTKRVLSEKGLDGRSWSLKSG